MYLLAVLFIPVWLVHASVLSFVSDLLNGKKTLSQNQNSQTIALLSPENLPNTGADVLIENDEALKAETGPLGTQADVEDYYPNSDIIQLYVIKSGDTIKSIANVFDVTANTIVWANNLKSGQALTPGNTLVILPISGLRYTVKKGDTLASIAKRFKADASDITSFNDVTELIVGENIIIPDGEIATPAPIKNSKGKIIKKGNSVFSRKFGESFDLSGPKSGDTVMRSKHGEKTWGFNAPSASGYYIFPVEGGRKTQDLHGFNGIDIGKGLGAPIRAAASGTVIVVRTGGSNGGYGNYIVIAHDNGTQTLYAHNSKNLVSVGDKVDQGQTIALMGHTGHAKGNHVHFEVRGAQNPFSSIASNSGDKSE